METKYTLEYRPEFTEWLDEQTNVVSAKVSNRLGRVALGSFGDAKSIGGGLYELRFNFGAGIRVYYTQKEDVIVVILGAGTKRTQSRDIEKIRSLIK